MCMYTIVESMLLCPSISLTCTMSLVLWYSVVAFQCRKVCRCIALSRGLFSFIAVLFLSDVKVTPSPCLWA